jgi:hypothetical protein
MGMVMLNPDRCKLVFFGARQRITRGHVIGVQVIGNRLRFQPKQTFEMLNSVKIGLHRFVILQITNVVAQ